MRRVTATLAAIALATSGCASAIEPRETPRRDFAGCQQAREIVGRIEASPAAGVRRQTAIALAAAGDECARAIEIERNYNAAAARANKPDTFGERLERGALWFGSGFLVGLIAALAALL